MSKLIHQHFLVPAEYAGKRLDQIAVALLEDYSRARIQDWIKQAAITIDGQPRRAKDKLYGGETLELQVTLEEDDRWEPEAIELTVVYEDDDIIIINKPAGLVVHPGAGVGSGTLLNGLLYRYPELASLPRAGIVHRLDKDTTGLMVVARSLVAHTSLVQQLQTRSLGREYEAIALGELTAGGMVDKPIGRHPTQRIKMAVVENQSGKEAITHYRVMQRFSGYTHIACKLETGRTHQIRVHMAYIKHALVGDPVYSRQKYTARTCEDLKATLSAFQRQALHAKRLTLIHPARGEEMSWQAPLPEDMQQLITALSQYAAQ